MTGRLWSSAAGSRRQLGSQSGQHQPRRCRKNVLPLPPLAEQHRIVAEVERRLSVVAEVEAAAAANLRRAGAAAPGYPAPGVRGQAGVARPERRTGERVAGKDTRGSRRCGQLVARNPGKSKPDFGRLDRFRDILIVLAQAGLFVVVDFIIREEILMSRVYRHPPLVEALCEFQFAEGDWDWTVPGLMYQEIKDDIPHKAPDASGRVRSADRRQAVEPAGERRRRTDAILPALTRAPLCKSARTSWPSITCSLILIGTASNRLFWITLHFYRRVANPSGFKRLGLRYINRIDIPSTKLELQEYFNFRTAPARSYDPDADGCLAPASRTSARG